MLAISFFLVVQVVQVSSVTGPVSDCMTRAFVWWLVVAVLAFAMATLLACVSAEAQVLSAGGDRLAPQLQKSLCPVHCAKGDVACAEETACILSGNSVSSERPLHSIMHAGAVLDSKVITNIRVDGIRTEFSGELEVPLSGGAVEKITEVTALHVAANASSSSS